ncbi:hypothetical protein HanRHA438_Chr14g0631361 [Helianthus annuus]|nr:hypothetical protein HanRHA438_Chr14g0631361 [Helianthus annuus]
MIHQPLGRRIMEKRLQLQQQQQPQVINLNQSFIPSPCPTHTCVHPRNRSEEWTGQADIGNQCSGHLGYDRLNKLMHTVSFCWRTPFNKHFIAPTNI